VVRLFARRTELTTVLQGLQQQRNANAAAMKGKLEAGVRAALIEEGKKLKDSIAAAEAELEKTETELAVEVRRIPNMAHPDAPKGKEDKDNLEVKRVGQPRKFDFVPADHVKLGQDLDIIDFDSATKVSGTKFYYLKNEGVFLELALTRYALDILQGKGFTPFITPDVAREEILEGIGFNPRGAESNVYTLEGEGTCLVGTAEITLGGYYSETILSGEKLPLRMAGLSHCFRREAGAAGQFSRGLYRVHQFTKVEMFVYCLPEESGVFHEELRSIEEEIFSGLEIPFRVVDTCTGDLGAPAYRKWDLEAWMPGRANPPSPDGGEWGEVTSTSNCTDYQARRLNIRYKEENGKNRFVHMLNGTAIAISRAIIAILENFQEADGSVKTPKALVPYCGFEVIRKR
jgi:seryl-tRNA synthetase